MNWVEREIGNVKLIHHSTSALIELKIKDEEGAVDSVWLDYYDFKNLIEVIEELKHA